MTTFDEELQALLDRHPEILEVKVKYKKGATFKPSTRSVSAQKPVLPSVAPIISQTSEAQKVAEMIKNGEL